MNIVVNVNHKKEEHTEAEVRIFLLRNLICCYMKRPAKKMLNSKSRETSKRKRKSQYIYRLPVNININ